MDAIRPLPADRNDGPPPAAGLPFRSGTWSQVQELEQAARDLESVFLKHMLDAMRKGLPGNPYFGHDPGTRTFEEQLNDQYGRLAAGAGGGRGLSGVLFAKLAPHLGLRPAGLPANALDAIA